MSSNMHDMQLLKIYSQLIKLLDKLDKIADDEMTKRNIPIEEKKGEA